MSGYFLERIGLTLRFEVSGAAGGTWDVVLGRPEVEVHLVPRQREADGVLRCLGHNFDFDLSTGQCLNARCDPIVVRPRDHDKGRHAEDMTHIAESA